MAGGIVNALVGLIVGLLAGLLTGYIFERRATKAAEGENARLRAELRALRESVYSVGAGRSKTVPYALAPQELMSELRSWFEARQDAEGKVSFARAIAEFVGRGFTRSDVEAATRELSTQGHVERESSWVRVL